MGDGLPRYRTGDPAVDAEIAALVDRLDDPETRDLVFEMIVSAVRLDIEDADLGEMKLVNRTLKELRYSFAVFRGHAGAPKCTIFGSARTRPDEAAYDVARRFGAAMVEAGWMVMTGAGPGIMAAGIEGAGTANSFGINIDLPFESSANRFIVDDPKLINFRYFFTRKLAFMKESQGYALLPGGFGTMDELFELLTLMQTGKSTLAPVVLIDPPDSTYWERWLRFVEDELLETALISPADLGLVHMTSDIDAAVAHIVRFYRTYHSSRFVGRRLVIRLQHPIDDTLLSELNDEFADILVDGTIERCEPADVEVDDHDEVDRPRIRLSFDRGRMARLRQLIDRLNGAQP